MANSRHKTLLEAYYHRPPEGFNSSLAHKDVRASAVLRGRHGHRDCKTTAVGGAMRKESET